MWTQIGYHCNIKWRCVNRDINMSWVQKLPYFDQATAIILMVFSVSEVLFFHLILVKHCSSDVIGNNVCIISLRSLNLPMEYFNDIKVYSIDENYGALINTTNALLSPNIQHWPTIVIFYYLCFSASHSFGIS